MRYKLDAALKERGEVRFKQWLTCRGDYGSDIELLQRLILQKRPATTTTPTSLISSNVNENEQAAEGGSTSTMSSALSVLHQIADSAATQRQREQQRLLIASQKAIIQKAAAEYAASAAASSGSQQLRHHPMVVDDDRELVEPAVSSVMPTTTATATTAIAADVDATACHEMKGMIAYSIECIAMRGSAALPYLLTLGEKIAQEARGGEMEQPTLCSPVTSTPYRNRNITSDTFVCLNRTRPSDVEQKNDGVSAYADCWQRGHVDPDEKWVIANFLSTGSTKPRMSTGDNFCYTTANKSSRSLLTTHSTFWELQNRHGIRASAHELAAAILIDPKHCLAAATANHMPAQLEVAGTSGGNVTSSFVTFETTPATPGELLQYEPVAGRKRSVMEMADSDDADGDVKPHKLISIHVKPKVMKLPATVSKATLEATISRMNVRKEHAKEVEVYVRGRGRGRYVCDRCGIRCKKPSMLKKHLKSHTNDRPYTCITCNFAFKTKGNLTKHLYSKAHRRRMVDSKSRDDRHQYDPVTGRPLRMGAHSGAERDVGRLVVDESEDAELAPNLTELCDAPAIRKLTELEAKFVNDDYWAEDDAFDGDDNNEDEEMLLEAIEEGALDTGLTYRRFGQENILVERSTHTPPTLWGAAIPKAEMGFEWPKSEVESRCHSAPPVAMCSTEWWPLEAQRPSKRPSSKATRRMDAAAKRAEEECGRLEPCTSVTQPPPPQPQPTTSSFLLADGHSGMGVRAQVDHHEGGGGGGGSSASQQQLIANFIPQPHFIAQSQAAAAFNFSLGPSSTQHEQASQAAAIDLNVLKITQPQLAALIASAILGKSDSQSQTHVVEQQQQSGFILPAFAAQPIIVHPPIQQPNDVSALGNFVTAEEYSCTMCDKKFRKESELSLHKQTHIIENRVIAKSRIHSCPECKMNLKTKLALSKHLESAHSSSAITGTTTHSNDATAEISSDSADQPHSNAATSQNSSGGGNPGFRSFVCNDCNLGFRSNGVLGKHLRSKNHVKALIAQGKLPVDAANLIRDHAYILAKIDATDCESAKSSLLSLLERVRDDNIERLSAPPPPKHTSQLPGAVVSSLSSSTPTTTANAISLECREHLGSVSPVAPQTITMIGVDDASHRLGVKRKNTEEDGIIGIAAADSRRTSATHVATYVLQTPNSRVVERPPPSKIFVPMIEGSSGSGCGGGGGGEEDGDESENYPGSPLYSLANVAVAAAAASHHNSPLSVNSISNHSSSIRMSRMASSALHNKTMITNVWVPPRMDQVERRIGTPDSASSREASKQMMEVGICREHVGSNRSAEETSSISTSRSESATPILRSGASINVGGSNGVAASPVPAITTIITHCQLCDADFPTSTDLQVHFHTDHVVMRDGKDYKCPRYNCDRVYPSRETLRLHIIAHYFGGGSAAAPPDDEPGIADSPSDSASCCGGASSPALRKKSSVLHTPTVVIPSAPVQSPGTPEETHTNPSKKGTDSGTKQQANRKQGSALRSLSAVNHNSPNTTPGSEQKLRCHICGHLSADAAELNSHHLSAHCGTKLP